VVELLKRLEIIKNLIIVEDEEILLQQVTKIKKFQNNTDIEKIIDCLESKQYSQAIIAIEQYLSEVSALTKFIDPIISGLKMELRSLETELTSLIAQKDEYQQTIEHFNILYFEELGSLLEEILNIKKTLFKKKADIDDAARKDYEKIRAQQKSFSEDYHESKDKSLPTLSSDEEQFLRVTYKNAAKLCHPDIVAEDQKAAAEKTFKELSDAYRRKDFKTVNRIYDSLVNRRSFIFNSDSIDDGEHLQVKIDDIKLEIERYMREIEKIKNSSTFKTIVDIEDNSEYFTRIRLQLNQEYEQLKVQLEHQT
jgi:hypothetical protein